MITAKTHKVKLSGYEDAVIYVYEERLKILNPEEDDSKKKYKVWQEVVAVVPFHFSHDEMETNQDDLVNRVNAAAQALANTYEMSTEDCHEISVGVYLNFNKMVNLV
jgi:hypothetical protein